MSDVKSQHKKIYGPYDHHISCSIHCLSSEDKTKQSFGPECDINAIMARYEKTGIIESGNSQTPIYGEASAFDFQQAQNTIIIAENMFNNLPAAIRSKFDNNPQTMLEYMDNPENIEEATKMGLLRAVEVVSGGTIPLTTERATDPVKSPTRGVGEPTTPPEKGNSPK